MPSTLTVQNVIDEIGIHTAIARLDHVKYGAFTSSILLLGTLDQAAISTAFQNEDLKCQASSASAAAALSAVSKKRNNIITCAICKKQGHTVDQCWIVHLELKPCQGEGIERSNGTNQVKEHTQSEITQELAGNTSLWTLFFSSTSNNTNLCWNTDTGATSHMTPHHHWLQDYEAYRVPI